MRRDAISLDVRARVELPFGLCRADEVAAKPPGRRHRVVGKKLQVVEQAEQLPEHLHGPMLKSNRRSQAGGGVVRRRVAVVRRSPMAQRGGVRRCGGAVTRRGRAAR